MKRLRIGIIGSGHIAQTVHIPCYLNNPHADVFAICDNNKNLSEMVGDKFGIRHRFTNYEEMLQSNLVDAVSICTPTTTHSRIATEAARCGVHVLCEKPIASTLEEAEEMLQKVSKSGVKFTVGFNYRFLPNHIKAKEYLSIGKIGKLILVRGEVVTAGPYGSEFPQSEFNYQAEKRLGSFFDLGSHVVDLLLWILGKPTEVFATCTTHMNGVSVDDLAVVTLRFESGVIGSIITSWLNLPNHEATADCKKIELIGSEGKLDTDFFGPSLFFYSKSSLASKIRGKIEIIPSKFNPKDPSEALKWSYRKEIDSFVESVINNKPVAVTGKEAKACLEVVLAAYKSSETGSIITLGR